VAVQISYGYGNERCVGERTSMLVPKRSESQVHLCQHKKIILGPHTQYLCVTNTYKCL
jgi:hypothetical protein